MEMTLQEFIDKYNGKGIDFDGHYGFQCVDLYRQYVQEVLGFPQSPGVSGAKDIWNSYLSSHFDRIANTPEGVPQPGDIMIWDDKYGPYGHVAVVTKATINTFTCFSQNDPTGSLSVIKTYKTYGPTLGWLHPKIPDNTYRGYDLSNKESMKVCVDQQIKVTEGLLVDKSQYEAVKGKLEKSEERVGELSQQLGSANGTIKALTEKIESQNNIIGEFQKEDAVQIQTLRDSYDAQKIAESRLSDLLWSIEDDLHLPHTINDMTERISVAVGALQSVLRQNDHLQTKSTDLEKEVKRLNALRMSIDKQSTKSLIIYLLGRLLKRS